MTLPEPIGLRSDVEAALERLLPAPCTQLKAARPRGAAGAAAGPAHRRQRRSGRGRDRAGAAPATRPTGMRPLLALKLDAIDAGFGIDGLRLEALETEPLHAVQHRGHLDAAETARTRQAGPAPAGAETGAGLADLIGRLGTRLGEYLERRKTLGISLPCAGRLKGRYREESR
jgi:protein ImuB